MLFNITLTTALCTLFILQGIIIVCEYVEVCELTFIQN